jgi:amidase
MARRVEDLGSMLSLLAAPDPQDHTVIGMPFGDPGEVRMKGLRIAFFTDNGIVPAEAETIAVVRQAAAALKPDVNRIEERRPPGVEESYELEMRMIGPDGGDGLRAFLNAIGSTRTHPLLEGWLTKLEPYRTTLDGFAQYWAALDRFRARMFAFLEDFDAIISPVCPQAALPHGSSIEERTFRGFSYTMTHNLTGWPAAVVRCGQTPAGLPIGVQIAARLWREDVALRIAAHLEQAFGGWQPSPLLC